MQLSDNGTEFKNQILNNICEYFNVKKTFIVARHHASNYLVQTANRKILEILLHVTDTLQESWEDWLSLVAACINGSVKAFTEKTQHYVVYRSDKRLSYELIA